MNSLKTLEKELEDRYSDCNFYVRKNEEEIEIIYDNKKYLNDNIFLDNVINIASVKFIDTELWKVVTTYDVENIITPVLKRDGTNYGLKQVEYCPHCKQLIHPHIVQDMFTLKYCNNCGERIEYK